MVSNSDSTQVSGQPLVAPPTEQAREASKMEDLKSQVAATTSDPKPDVSSSSTTKPLVRSPSNPSLSSSSTNGSSTVSQYTVHHGHTVVPAYPYNVSMSPFIPGSSSGKQDSYFEQHVPDDSNVQTRLPSICVDYLSHDWQEDDVWASWKAMTKHKSEIANGVRLENASWRTWAKQRGRLKTISPETLNWLKDSDVTWLYGPLHTAVDAVPPPKAATTEDRLGLDKSGKSRSNSVARPSAASSYAAQVTVKPILKHRSLSDILSVPNSGASTPVDDGRHHMYGDDASDEGSDPEQRSSSFSSGGSTPASSGSGRASPATGILKSRHGRSGSADGRHPTKNRSSSDLAGDANGTSSEASLAAAVSSAGGVDKPGPASLSTDSKDSEVSPHSSVHYDLPSELRPEYHPDRRASSHASTVSAASTLHKPKRHITFNHRVERQDQIPRGAISGRGGKGGAVRGGSSQPYSNQLQRYGSSGPGRQGNKSGSDDDDSDTAGSNSDDEDILTFRSSSPKSPGFMKPLLSPNDPANAAGRKRQSLGGSQSARDHLLDLHTIAKMAPTTLKESELLPGPTPIVAFEDGRITALYGTEDDYVFDLEQQHALERDVGRGYLEVIGDEEALEDGEGKDDENSDEEDGESSSSTEDESEHYNAVPASAKATSAVAAAAAAQASEPASTSARFASEGDPSTLLNIAASTNSAANADYFSGPDLAVSDDFDNTLITSSQAKYSAGTTSGLDKRGDALPGSGTNSSVSSSTTISPSSSSAGIGLSDLSSSPSTRQGTPGKSILKKGREPAAGGEYYPAIAPASTRASRAHAAMFDENGDEIRSPRGRTTALPEPGGEKDPSAETPTGTPLFESTLASPTSSSSSQFPISPSQRREESPPTRGRSISRGSSSSSLYDRVAGSSGSLNSGSGSLDYYGANGRLRSASGGGSLSPIGSYVDMAAAAANSAAPQSSSLSSSQPIDIRSKGAVPSTKASTQRTAIYDTDSDHEANGSGGSSTQEEDADENDTMEMDDLTAPNAYAPHPDSAAVRFARTSPNRPPSATKIPTTSSSSVQSGIRTNSSSSIKQYHQQLYDEEDDDAMVETQTMAEEEDGPGGQDFEGRPTLNVAANVGRRHSSDTTITTTNTASQPVSAPASGKAGSSQGAGKGEVSRAAKEEEYSTPNGAHNLMQRRRRSVDGLQVALGEANPEEEDEKLFDSPLMPSSPHFSSTNLAELRWADKPAETTSKRKHRPIGPAPSKARQSLIRNLNSASSNNSTSASTSSSSAVLLGARRRSVETASNSSDSDPSSHGGSGYGFDLSDEEGAGERKGVVGKAIEYAGGARDLASALWTVGSGMLWRSGSSTGSAAGGAETTGDPPADE